MYNKNLALNVQQGLIYHKTQPNQTKQNQTKQNQKLRVWEFVGFLYKW